VLKEGDVDADEEEDDEEEEEDEDDMALALGGLGAPGGTSADAGTVGTCIDWA
jgi:hypothetical protein